MKFPNLFNAASSLLRLIRALFRREPVLVAQEVLDERLETCYACKRFEANDRQCLECTCFIDLKAQLDTETCPLKKWKT